MKPVHLRPIHGALGAAAILALAACGANGDSSTDRDAIEALLVRHYATLPCDDLADAGRTEFGHPVPDEECEADLASQETKDVEVSEIEVDGDRATAVVDSFTFRLV